MRIVYVLCSAGRDVYSVMARVSIASVRLTNPSARVSIMCDAVSEAEMRRIDDPLLKEMDDIIVRETPPGDALFRSRFVKTGMRALVDGPFVFLDSDLVVRGPLDDILATTADVAGAPNLVKGGQISPRERKMVAAMGWSHREDAYINTGVLFFSDSDAAHRFGEDWHRKWLEFHGRGIGHRDQPAFNSALVTVRPRFDVLPNRFNAQVKAPNESLDGAVIWHYFASMEAAPTTTFELMVRRLLRGEPLDTQGVEDMIRSSHPWRRDRLLWVNRAKTLGMRVHRRLKSLGRR